MEWVPIIFGWPAVGASVVVTLVGVARTSSRLAMAGAILALPFMGYMFGTPRFRLAAPPVFALHMVAAHALRRGHRVLALLLFLPFACFATFVAWLVMSQEAG